jgi:predicted AlkP superfamily pyrophosphatase or phosphodiesterase
MLFRFSLIILLGWIFSPAFIPPLLAAGQAKYFVLVVWDGMRPDFVSPELTPNLQALRESGVWFANHHSVFPTSSGLPTPCKPSWKSVTNGRPT